MCSVYRLPPLLFRERSISRDRRERKLDVKGVQRQNVMGRAGAYWQGLDARCVQRRREYSRMPNRLGAHGLAKRGIGNRWLGRHGWGRAAVCE
jgi:hypothetical protein